MHLAGRLWRIAGGQGEEIGCISSTRVSARSPAAEPKLADRPRSLVAAASETFTSESTPTRSRAAFASALRPDIRDPSCGFSSVQLQDREGESAQEGYDILRTVCRARKVVKALETGQGVENVDHFIPRARGRFVVPLREPVDDGP